MLVKFQYSTVLYSCHGTRRYSTIYADEEKNDNEKCTYRKVGQPDGGPWDTRKFAEIDHVLIRNRQKNMITNVAADTKANIDSDHYPVIWAYRQKLKSITRKTRGKTYILN